MSPAHVPDTFDVDVVTVATDRILTLNTWSLSLPLTYNHPASYMTNSLQSGRLPSLASVASLRLSSEYTKTSPL